MWSELVRDVRYTLRSVRIHPIFFATAVLILGLGVGGSTAIFSVVSPMLLRSLPFNESNRLVWIANSGSGGLSSVTSRTSNLHDYRRLNESFEQMSGYFAFFDYVGYNLTGEGEPERLVGVPVAQDFLEILGVRPLIGRNFDEGEVIFQSTSAVILTHGFWQRRFAGSRDVVGRVITINDAPSTVVGVLPASFDFATFFAPGAQIDFLSPFPISPVGQEADRQGNTLVMLARLKAGVSVTEAQAELDIINQQLGTADAERWGLGAVVTGLQEKITGRFRRSMLLLAGAAGLLMVIVCANLSNLLLTRAAGRRKEIAVRGAMGASRARLIRQLLTETFVLATVGTVGGVGVAYLVTRGVSSTSGISVPLLQNVGLDPTALLFSASLAMVAGLTFGIVPALQISVSSQQAALTDTGRGSSVGRSAAWVREALVVSEVALACVLLIGGGLLLRSFIAVLDVDLGFRDQGAMAWRVDTAREFESGPERLAYFDSVVRSVAAVPGIDDVGFSDTLPLGRNRGWSLRVKGVEYPPDECCPGALPRLVSPGYLQTMRIGLVSGRYLEPTDTLDTELVIVVNQTAARDLFPDVRDPINRVLLVSGEEFRLVGIVSDVRHSSLEEASSNEMYILATQQPSWWGAVELVARTSLPPAAVASSVRAAIRTVDPNLPASDFQTLSDIVERSVSPRRFTLLLVQTFAFMALLLASLGIYGVLSYSVSQRTKEIGIRMALGAEATHMRRQVLGRTLTMTSIGIAIGFVGAFGLGNVIASLLYGVDPIDPVTYGAVSLILLSIATVAGYLPARRASRVDPMTALTT